MLTPPDDREAIQDRADALRPYFRRIAAIVARQTGIAPCPELEQVVRETWFGEVCRGALVTDATLSHTAFLAWSHKRHDGATT